MTWHDHHLRPCSRTAIVEAAESCLEQERSRLYAVYRPHSTVATPTDYVALIRAVEEAGLARTYGTQLVALFVGIVRKPLHPQHGVLSPWDLRPREVCRLGATMIQSVAAALEPTAALRWVAQTLGVHGDGASAAPAPSGPCLRDALLERLERSSSGGPTLSSSDEAILLSAPVVAAVSGALIRTGTTDGRRDGLQLLEKAARARLLSVGDAELFNEDVAVHCAEAAATVGDTETVTRIMFLLYRTRGALGMVRHASPSWRTYLTLRKCRPQTPPLAAYATDAAFDGAERRLLASCMRASLGGWHTLVNSPVGRAARLDEAAAFFETMGKGCSWEGSADMARELLAYAANLQQQHTTGVGVLDTGVATTAYRILHCILQRKASAHTPEAESASIRAACIHEAIRAATPVVPCDASDHVALVPLFLAPPGADYGINARRVLSLFDSVEPDHQEPLLPYALAASLCLLHTAAHDVDTSLASIARYFCRVQTAAHYVISPGDPHSGALVMLLWLSLTAQHRTDPQTASVVQRLSGVGTATECMALAGHVQCRLLSELLTHIARASSLGLQREWHLALQSGLCQSLNANLPGLSCVEAMRWVPVLYHLGVPPDGGPVVDRILSVAMGFPVRTASLERLAVSDSDYPGAMSSSGSADVLVVTSASALEQDGSLLLQHQLKDALTAVLPKVEDSNVRITMMLTPLALAHLRRIQDGVCRSNSLCEAVLSALREDGSPSVRRAIPGPTSLRVVVAAPCANARPAHDGDGIRETCALAVFGQRHQKIYLWNDGLVENTKQMQQIVQRHRVQLVSVRRALVGRAKEALLQVARAGTLRKAIPLTGASSCVTQVIEQNVEGCEVDGNRQPHNQLH